MLYLLSQFSDVYGPLRLFDYVTFRAGCAGGTAFLLVLLLGGPFAAGLKKLNMQAACRYAELFDPQWVDKEKERTPCMGGVLIIAAVVLSSLLWMAIDTPIAAILLLTTTAFSLLGFADDFQKVFRKKRDGISEKTKIFWQLLISAGAVTALAFTPGVKSYMADLMVPLIKEPARMWSVFAGVPMWAWYMVCGIMAAGVLFCSSNAVNLTDGKDGLATGCTIFSMLTYAAIAYLMGHRVFAGYLNIPYIAGISEAVVFSAAVTGGCIGFLWHNCHPASMFMGDTGSLALGGAVGLMAVLCRQEILLLLVGWVFVMEAGSSFLQRYYFKLTGGKRLFLCAPIHHHFERKNWTETQIVVRFWIISGICSLLALATLKLR